MSFRRFAVRRCVVALALVLGVVIGHPLTSMSDERCTIIGSRRADVIHGTDRADVICGLGGADRIYGESGNDIVIGGDGNDLLVGRDGDDMLSGGAGVDDGLGGRGDDGCSVEAAESCESRWLARFDDPKHLSDGGRFIAISPDGGTVFVGGLSERTNREQGSLINDPDHDFQVIAYATGSGRVFWSAVADGPASGHDRISAIAVARDGSAVFVTGTMSSSDPYQADQMTTIAFASDTGQKLWTRAIDSTNAHTAFGSDLAVDPAGALLYVCGGVDGAAAVVALDTVTGQEEWRASVAAPGYARCETVDVRADGSSVAVGGQWFPEDINTSGQNLMASFATTDGHERWKRTPDTAAVEDFVQDVEVGADGTFYAISAIPTADGYLSKLFALAPETGTTRWTSTYAGPGPGDDRLIEIIAAPDGSAVYAAGTSAEPQFEADMVTLAFDATTGAVSWEARFDPDANYDDALSIQLAPDGSAVYTSGPTRRVANGTVTAVLATYDAVDGSELALVRSQSDQTTIPFDSVIDLEGTTVFVTGQRSRGFWPDVVTWAYPI